MTTMAARRAIGGGTATLSIAGLTWKRILRGKAIWVTLVLALIPALIAVLVVGPRRSDGSGVLLEMSIWLLAILPPLHVASSLSEELEDRTAAYLWSRPIPRWTIISGKLLALIPLIAVAEIGGALLAAWRIDSIGTTAHIDRLVIGLGLGTVTAACCAAGISTLYPKHGMGVSIVYLLLADLAIGAIPAALQNLSITHHVRSIIRDSTLTATPFVGLGAISAVWLVIALSRIRRLE